MSDFNEHTAPAGWPHHRRPVSTAPGALPAEPPATAHDLSLVDSIDAFLLNRQVANCTTRTVQLYREVLQPFEQAVGPTLAGCTPLAVQKYFAALRARVNGTTAHLHFSKVRAFLTWATDVGFLPAHPMRGLTMKAPQTLPRVPEDWEVSKLLAACPATSWEGARNRALVALLADSALRISEALHVRVGDISFKAQTVRIRAGKGQRVCAQHPTHRRRTPTLTLPACRVGPQGLRGTGAALAAPGEPGNTGMKICARGTDTISVGRRGGMAEAVHRGRGGSDVRTRPHRLSP